MKTTALLLASQMMLTGIACAQTTPEDAPWMKAARGAYMEAQRLGIPFDISIVENPDPIASPIAMHVGQGRCTLLLQHRGNRHPYAKYTHPVHYEFSVAHEFGHCLMGVAGIKQSERAADAFALTWVWGRMPAQAPEAEKWIASMRSQAESIEYREAASSRPVKYRDDLFALMREIALLPQTRP